MPEDLRIIGFDDIEECLYSCPRLSSVRPDLGSLAETALELIASSLRDGPPDPQAVEHQVSHEVVVRESSAGRRPA